MKVALDVNKCRGFGVCIGVAPEYFDVADDGIVAVVLKDVVDGDDLDVVSNAARSCPARAISLSDD